jgi:uncharacterized protein
MLEFTALHITLGIVGVIVAGLAKGGFGGSGAFAGTTILALAISPEVALGIMLPILIGIDAVTLGAYWRKWSWVDAKTLMLAGTLGTLLGWLLFGSLSPDIVKLSIGTVAILFSWFRIATWAGFTPSGPSQFRPARAWLWGTIAGLTSFVAHAGGPPAAMTLIPRQFDKTTFQATTVIVFWYINLAKLGPFAVLGLLDGTNLLLSMGLMPFAGIGVWLGVIGHKRIPQLWFDALVVGFLMIAGLKLILEGSGLL